MYNKITIAFVLLLLSGTASKAQEAIEDIRTYYKTIGDEIKECMSNKEDKVCNLYSNIHLINTGALSWRGSGEYKKEIQFWYEDSPQYCDECGENGINVLKKVISSEQVALTNTYKEWLFKDGKLIFYYIKNTGEQEEEYRYYYQNDVLIKHVESGNTMNGDEAAKKYKEVILQNAKSLQQQFLMGF